MTTGTELHRVGGGMNAVLHLEGPEAAIILTMKDLRLHGIPFVTCEHDNESMVNKGIWRSSREILESWSMFSGGVLPNIDCDFYCYVRERDVEVAIITSRVRTKVISRERKLAETGA